jgi:hypothetical protein
MSREIIFSLALVYGSLMMQPQNSGADTIWWAPGKRLAVADYKGRIDSTSKFKAVSYFVRPNNWTYKRDSLFITLSVFFRPSASWFMIDLARPSNVTALLAHEQGHFDIYEIEMRKARKRFIANHGTITRYNYKRVVEQYVADINYFLEKRQKLYDQETEYSMNWLQQKAWCDQIALELNELEPFSKADLALPVRK